MKRRFERANSQGAQQMPPTRFGTHGACSATGRKARGGLLRGRLSGKIGAMAPPLMSLVLYVRDLDASLRFYTDLGLQFLEDDRCEDSARRFSALLAGDAILELRSCGDGPPTRTRLGFALLDPGTTVNVLGRCAIR